MRKTSKGAVIALSAAAMFTAGQALAEHHKAAEPAQDAKVKCVGVNDCAGKGECASKGNECAGKNECKSSGMIKLSADDCKAKGGTVSN